MDIIFNNFLNCVFSYFFVLYVICLYVNSYFGFDGRILVLTVSDPGHCLTITFVAKDCAV